MNVRTPEADFKGGCEDLATLGEILGALACTDQVEIKGAWLDLIGRRVAEAGEQIEVAVEALLWKKKGA